MNTQTNTQNYMYAHSNPRRCSHTPYKSMRGSRKFCQRGSNSEKCFCYCFFQLIRRGERIQITLKAGHHRPNRETPFKWHFADGFLRPNIVCWLGSFVIFQGIRNSISKQPFSFVVLKGCLDPRFPPPPPPLDPHMTREVNEDSYKILDCI